MAPKATLALLFHPKKGAKKDTTPNQTSPRKSSATPRPKPVPVIEEEEEELKLPDGPYQEFRLMSSALNGWKYDVMKFDSRKPVDISRWTAPIKLNRKEMRRDDGSVNSAPEAVGPMLGPDGKPVIGADGKFVMVDAEGRPIHNTDGSSANGKGKGAGMNAKKRFQKKTRQVYYVPEEVRQLRREERYPWVMEDSSQAQNEVWIGQMEDAAKSETHAFFMPAANDIFKFVPAHRWYKFQKKLKHDLPTDTANVESLYTLNQKRDPQAWLASRNGKGPSAATSAMFKAEAEGRSLSGGSSLVHSSGQSLGPGGRKLKTVDSGMSSLFDDDEDGDSKRRREKEYGGDGDLDEQVYEADFADDEEHMEVDENDEEAKETEERLKREYKNANKQRDAGVDESDEEETPGMTKQAKAMQKLIRNREGNDVYESEEEENPYASSVEEEEEELPVTTAEPAIQPQQQQTESDSQSNSQLPASKPGPSRPQTSSGTGSRATSPSVSPPLGGHSIVAKRATSPKIPKMKTNNMSRGNSPLNSRATSPVTNSRAASPNTGAAGSRSGSPTIPNPTSAQKPTNKRKATDDHAHGLPSPNAPNGSTVPKPKKRKALPPGVTPIAVPAEELRVMLIDWLGNTPNATTRECIHHFTPYLTDGEKKTEFSALVREVAQLKGGVLVLRKKFQEGGSTAPSPTPTPTT